MAPRERALVGGVAVLLLGTPWHELIVALWRPLGAWDELVLVFLAGALALGGRQAWPKCPFLPPVVALAAASALSAAVHGGSLWPLRAWLPYTVAGVAACALPRRAVRPLLLGLLATGALAALYGLVTFLALKAVGGGPHLRPPLPSWMPEALVFPYYSGAVPRSGHLVGPFMNDLYFGLWLAGMLGLVAAWRPRELGRAGLAGLGALLLLALAWAYSRSGYLALLVVVAFLGIRVSPRLLLVPVVAALLALPFLNPTEVWRLRHAATPSVGSPGRLAMVQAAAETLAHGAFLGSGPGTVRLADTQFAKIVVETGWPGALALAWLLVVLLRRPGAGDLATGLVAFVLALLVGGLSGEILEVPQVALSFWIVAGLSAAEQRAEFSPVQEDAAAGQAVLRVRAPDLPDRQDP